MEEFLSMDNILGEDEIENLFVDTSEEVTEDPEDKEKEKEKETTEVNVETLFTGPESVGSGDEDIEQEDTSSDKDDDISPKNHFYSSIAKALKDEGIFPDLEDEDAENINTPEDLAEAIEKQIQARFDERQQRIDKALQLEIETSEIKKYENVLNYLDSIKDSALTDESEEGENLRKQLIYQDFINRGYSKERAEREISKSFSAGTDIEDAREALEGNKNFFNESYNNLIKEAEEEKQKFVKKREEQAALLKDSILKEDKVFGDLSIDKATRQKIFDNLSKPVYKDPKTGALYTAIQKYEKENKNEFLKNIGILFTLTNGFKDIDGLVKTKARKEVKKGFKDLEAALKNTSTDSDGNLRFVSGVGSNPILGKNYKLDI